MLLAIALGVRSITSSMWLDEAATATATDRSFAQLFAMLGNVDAAMAGYYTAMHAWVSIVGTSVVALRSPSLIATAVTVVFVGLIARKLCGDWIGLLAALLAALSPLLVHYSIEARPYAIAIALTTGAALIAVTRPVSLRWLWSLVAALAVLTHFLAILTVLPQWLWLATGGDAKLRRPSVSKLVLVLPPLVVALAFVIALLDEDSLQSWIEQPTFLSVAIVGYKLLTPAGVVLFVPTIAALIVLVSRRPRRKLFGNTAIIPISPTDAAVLLLWAIAPSVILLFASLVWKPMFLDRYAIMSAPAVVLILAIAAGSAARGLLADRSTTTLRAVGIAAAAVVLVLALLASGLSAIVGLKRGWGDDQGVAAKIANQAKPGDAIVFAPTWTELGPEWYLDHVTPSKAVNVTTIPGTTAITSNSLWPPTLTSAQAIAQLHDFDRAWLVSTSGGLNWNPIPDVGTPVATYVKKCWRRESVNHFGQTTVSLWVRGASQTIDCEAPLRS